MDPGVIYEQGAHNRILPSSYHSPKAVQRDVDQITSEIKNNCDLRKSLNFSTVEHGNQNEGVANEKSIERNQISNQLMEYDFFEPMDAVGEEFEFDLYKTDINPFDKSLITGLLRKIKFPQSQHAEGFVKLGVNLAKFVPSITIRLGNDIYDLEKCLGKGTYGTVFKGTDPQHNCKTVALKMQKPAWVWEFYIAREIKHRLTNPHMIRGFMDVRNAYVADNSSVLVTDFSKYGTLLEVQNKIKVSTGKPLIEPLAIFFTIEMIQIIEHLHKCKIIHADIKPDNFLLMHLYCSFFID